MDQFEQIKQTAFNDELEKIAITTEYAMRPVANLLKKTVNRPKFKKLHNILRSQALKAMKHEGSMPVRNLSTMPGRLNETHGIGKAIKNFINRDLTPRRNVESALYTASSLRGELGMESHSDLAKQISKLKSGSK